MTNDEKYITLKEAATLSGYSADYIGQLIRQGKIPGKQVYTNITWMTTAEAVTAYKAGKEFPENKQATLKYLMIESRRKIKLEMDIFWIFIKTFKSILPLLIILIFGFFTLLIFTLHSFLPAPSPGRAGTSENKVLPFSY